MEKANLTSNTILERAEAALIARDFDQAARLYKSLLIASPKNAEYIEKLGDLYVKAGSDELALGYYNSLVNLEPENVEALNNVGAIYRRMGQYDDSIAVLEKAVMIDDTYPQTYYNLGFTFRLMGKYDDAIECFERVVEKNPSDALAHNHIGSIYAALKKYPEAVQSYLKGLKADPNHPVIHFNLAKTYRALNDFDKAKMSYENALRSKPLWTEVLEDYTGFLLENNETHNAGEMIRKALGVNPKNVAMLSRMGDVHFHRSEYEDAQNSYVSALSVDAKFLPALNGLASSYDATDRSDDALEVVSRMTDIAPDDKNVKKTFARILLSSNRKEEAVDIINQMLSENNNDEDALSLLGQYYICSGEEKKAMGCFKKIKEINPDNSSFLKDYARRYEQAGNLKRAEEFLLSYMKEHPENIDGVKKLASNYEKQGKLEKAVVAFEQVENLDSSDVSARKSIDRLSKKVEAEKLIGSSETADELFEEADDDIFITPVKQENEEPDLSEKIFSAPVVHSQPEPETSKEPVITLDKEELDRTKQDDTANILAQEEISPDAVFNDIDLDEEIMIDSQDKYVQLDDLISDDSFDEGDPSLIENNTTAEDFFDNTDSSPKVNPISEEPFEMDFEQEKIEQTAPAPSPVTQLTSSQDEPKPQVLQVSKTEENVPQPQQQFQADDSVSSESQEFRSSIESKLKKLEERIDAIEVGELITEKEVPEIQNDEDLNNDKEFENMDSEINDEVMENMEESPESIMDIQESQLDESQVSENNDAALFKTLLNLTKFLPAGKKEEFLSSRGRLQLEYIISRLSGKKNLRTICNEIRKEKGISDKGINLTGLELLRNVLSYCQDFSLYNKDSQIAQILYSEIGVILEKLPK